MAAVAWGTTTITCTTTKEVLSPTPEANILPIYEYIVSHNIRHVEDFTNPLGNTKAG